MENEEKNVRFIQQESSGLFPIPDKSLPQHNQSFRTIRYFSMFTGVGGFELGLEVSNAQPKEKDNNTQSSNTNIGNRSNEKMQRFTCIGFSETGELGLEKTKSKICKRGDSPSIKITEGFKHSIYPSFECVGFSEIDKYANQLLATKFPNVKNYGDATKINPSELPDFDMLCGGFPCQSFSIAGKRKGFVDARGSLFEEIMRIAEVKKPKIIFLENVKGLLSAPLIDGQSKKVGWTKGYCFAFILQRLDELGYNVQWFVLNSKFFGVPQNRERVFIIGSLRGQPIPEILPFRTSSSDINEKLREKNSESQTITSTYYKGGKGTNIKMVNKSDREISRIYSPDGVSPSLHLKTEEWQEPKISLQQIGNYIHNTRCRIAQVNEEEISEYLKQALLKSNLSKKQIAEKINLPYTQVEHYFRGKGIKGIALPDDKVWLLLKKILEFDNKYDKEMTEYKEYVTSKHQGNRIYSDKEAPTLNRTIEPKIEIQKRIDNHGRITKREDGNIFTLGLGGRNIGSNQIINKIRRLTPVECERLQGFPDNWTAGFSDTQRYRMMGNAVTTNVIRAIGTKLAKLEQNQEK